MTAEVTRREFFEVGVVNPTLMLHRRKCNNNYGKKTMKFLGPLIWNSIPTQILKLVSYTSFKTSLKKHFIGQYGNDNSNCNNSSTVNLNSRITYSNSHRTNNYGMLTDENRNGRFQSRWDDGPNNLIWQTRRMTRPDSDSIPVFLLVYQCPYILLIYLLILTIICIL